MKFTKMHGLGNDYVYVNAFTERVADPAGVARLVADRFTGIGSDGLILICPSDRADVRMEMYNADGSRGRMCGNGIRCVAKYAYDHGLIDAATAGRRATEAAIARAWTESPGGPPASELAAMTIESDAGLHELALRIDMAAVGQVSPAETVRGVVTAVRVDMGRASLAPGDLPCTLSGERIVNRPVEFGGRRYEITCVSMGNPHVVIFAEDLASIDLPREGRAIETSSLFPERTNVHFARVLAPDRLRMITWERGSGATRACGTGACAVAVAGVVAKGTSRDVCIELPGGELEIAYRPDGHVHKTGPAVEVFSGEWPAPGNLKSRI